MARRLHVSSLMIVQAAVEKFRRAMCGVLSPRTLYWYGVKLSPLLKAFGDREVKSLALDDFRELRAALAGRGLSPWTLHGHLRAMRRLFKWLCTEGVIESNPTQSLELPRLPMEARKGIAYNDMRLMLEAARAHHPRDHALMMFLADTAARIGGASGLRLSDIDLDAGRAIVREKGNRERAVYFKPSTSAALARWLDVRAGYSPQSDHVFISLRDGGRLSGRALYSVLKRTAERAGVSERWNPHAWRHGAARGMLTNGASLAHVSQLLGHKDVNVTVKFYGAFADDELQEAHSRYSWAPDS